MILWRSRGDLNNDDEDYMHLNDCKLKAVFTLGVIMVICFEPVTLVFSPNTSKLDMLKRIWIKNDFQHKA